MRDDASAGIKALVAVFEIDPGKAETHHGVAAIGRQPTLHQGVAALRGEDGLQMSFVRTGGVSQLMRGLVRIPQRSGHGVEIADRQIARDQHTIAVHEIGAHRMGDGSGARCPRAGAKHHDIDKPRSDDGKCRGAEKRRQSNPAAHN